MKSMKFILSGVLLSGLAFVSTAQAQRVETLTVDMNHQVYRGQNQVLRIKQELNRAYPRLNLNNANLQRVVVYAKSRAGRGTVELQIDGMPMDRKTVPDSPNFQNNLPRSYHAIALNAIGREDRGTWQLILDGNIKVQKIDVRIRYMGRPGPGPAPRIETINVGRGDAQKFFGDVDSFQVRIQNAVALQLRADGNLLEVRNVTVTFGNGQRVDMPGLAGTYFNGQSREVAIANRNIRRISVDAISPIPFGPTSKYDVIVKAVR